MFRQEAVFHLIKQIFHNCFFSSGSSTYFGKTLDETALTVSKLENLKPKNDVGVGVMSGVQSS